jgi:hypothetical protein
MSSIVLFRPRRTRRRPSRSTLDKYQALPCCRLDQGDPCRREHRRCQVGQQGLVGLWVQQGLVVHRDPDLRSHQVAQVGLLLLVVLGLLGWPGQLWLGRQAGLSLRPSLAGRVDLVGRVGLVVQQHRLYQVDQVVPVVQECQLRRVDLVDRAVQVGTVCTAGAVLRSKFPTGDGRGRLGRRGHQVCLVYHSFRAFLVGQEVQASSSCRIPLAFSRSFGYAQHGRW